MPVLSNLHLNSTTSTSFSLNAKATTTSKVSYKVHYGTSKDALTDSTTAVQGGTGESFDNVSIQVSGLTANSTYFARLSSAYTDSTFSKSDILAIYVGDDVLAYDSLKLWYAADYSLSGLANLDKIPSVFDVSGYGNDAITAQESTRPKFVTSSINGKPAFCFDGNTSSLILPKTSTLGIKMHDYEIFIVAKSASSANQFLLAGTTLEFGMALNFYSGFLYLYSGGMVPNGDLNEFSDSKAHLFNVSTSISKTRNAVDRSIAHLYTSGRSSYDGTLTLGIRPGGYDALSGEIAEVLIYSKVLSDAEREKVATYLYKKYGIQNYANQTASLTGTEGWRLLASPVTNFSYNSLFKGIWIQGFTGAASSTGVSNVYSWRANSNTKDVSNWTE